MGEVCVITSADGLSCQQRILAEYMLMQSLAESGGVAGAAAPSEVPVPEQVAVIPEIDGPTGPEPTRYGDWERRGRCIDF
jgi:hypothetical protein